MKLIEYSVKNPVVVFVGVIFLLLFGYLAIMQMPYSLTPNISRPTISINTTWAGATPYEVEKEIVQRQEKFLKNLPNLISMTSSSREGVGVVSLEFEVGTDMKKAMLDTSSKLSEVRGYPSNIDNPVIRSTGETIAPVVYLFVKSDSKQSVRWSYTYLYEDIVKLYERIDGVGMVDILGGVAKQVEVILNTKQLAFYNITLDDVISAMQAHNVNVSAGSLDYGQRAYRVRTIGLYESSEDVYNTIVKTDNSQVVYLRDIANVINTYELPKVPNIHNNDETISLQIRPTAEANVLELIDKVRNLTNELNAKQLKEHHLHIDWGRDSAGFIQDAIALVKHDIILGILLAAIVLYAFLRNFSSVFVVSVIIPISILSSFILLQGMGRTLNVILLAGVSFAVSMIIDSSIVVVENIHRHHSMGKRMFESCIDGTKEVLGALFASTITTIGIFIPIIGLKDEIGQLFSDIALASSSALSIALIICLLVVPSLYYSLAKFLARRKDSKDSMESNLQDSKIDSKNLENLDSKEESNNLQNLDSNNVKDSNNLSPAHHPINENATHRPIDENTADHPINNEDSKDSITHKINSLFNTMTTKFHNIKQTIESKITNNKKLQNLIPKIKRYTRFTKFYLKKFKILVDTTFINIGVYFYNKIVKILTICLKSAKNRILCVLGFVVVSLLITLPFIPKLDYLPKGSQNFLVAYIQAPNGLSYEERSNIINAIYDYNAPYMLANGFKGDKEYPAIRDFYISGGTTSIYFYEISADPKRVKELMKLMQASIDSVPNISGSVVEQGIFSSSGISENVEVNIIGADLDSMLISANSFMELAKENLKGARIRAFPSLDVNNREINLYPDMRSLAVNGLNVKSFGNIVDVIIGGKKVGDFRNADGKIIDLMLSSDNTTQSPEDVLYSQIYAPSGQIVPLSSLADIRQDIGLSQIRHYEQDRNILFYINPQDSMSLQEVIATINNVIVPKMQELNTLGENKIAISGNANKLHKLAKHLSGGFLLALIITYLLLTALYANFFYPIIIIFTIPFALTGGFLGLAFVDTFIAHQNLDVLTMLGFIILVGSVVNNAILIVYQSLINLREYKMNVYDSVFNATTSRIRPIYMSMLTSILALAPLIFSSGAGSEIYRGLGAVIAGAF
ncbi:efflux RND transporter permease subunit [Helicobacter saguini]|uniref:Acriflavin resistance protein n=1 Tax=Helicobacter saguini TaxID=1548018 RepID=A0A6L7DD57_9HELI|nr:hypothetical protein [Helicobacter saguini]MWV69813.1 hypothetical protein [Helicobacter saguini]MWV72969.1 hypothetical protein [Helicobacter saguini]